MINYLDDSINCQNHNLLLVTFLKRLSISISFSLRMFSSWRHFCKFTNPFLLLSQSRVSMTFSFLFSSLNNSFDPKILRSITFWRVSSEKEDSSRGTGSSSIISAISKVGFFIIVSIFWLRLVENCSYLHSLSSLIKYSQIIAALNLPQQG